jgi:hypothetical protein|tara:strand:- start:593 stop:856 length:264 start_codon:yes stop_codon:yes gene_type:complete
MGSATRKISRRAEKSRKKAAKEDISQKMNMFDKIPEACSACQEGFNKQDREMVSTWSVVVRAEENIVRLYCPSCWSMAKKVVEEFTN